MEEDTKQLLISNGGDDESDYGIMNIQFSSEDLKCKRPFHVEPTNIVSVNDDTQRVTDEASAMNKRIHYYGRLTSPSDRALIAPDHVLPAPDEIYVYSPLGTAFKVDGCTESYGKNSSIVTIFMIWNTMMGTSILSIPWGIKQAGFTNGIILILLMGLLTLYCCYRVLKSRTMIETSKDTSNWEFPDVCKHYFGSFGQWSSLFFSMVSLVGAMVVYWVLMSNFLFNTGKFIYNYVNDINVTDIMSGTNGSTRVICPGIPNDPQPDNNSETLRSANNSDFELFEMWWGKSKTVPFYLIVVLLPLLNLKSPSFFAKFNVLGTVSVVYLIFLVTVKAAHLGFHIEFSWFTSNKFFVPEFRILFPQFTGVLTLAFFIHNCVITLLQNNKNKENNVRDLSIAYFLVGLTYLYVGVLIFATFPSPPLFKECIEQMMTVYPLLGYLARVQLLGQFFGNIYPSIFHVLALNIAIVGAGVAMAIFYPNIGGIIRYSGATCGLAFVFVYPSLIYMISLRVVGKLTWPILITHIFIIILGLANLIAQFLL
ncbi:PREDICTED: sodium-coupled neutral amino acid transporter 9 isoform X3 [Gavialis gangeticus]|uniref:sodium-coupled neutral amino acid transporter 9 isoform X3 n=1 Tax=Gavialis gangeticus TaxID=94835 RepID=UPI00092E2012|nr:PREDICTED: sodium-coupled neutral amino acid transporter 9 isoform X3 [Gavialis gangeticus]